MPLPSGAVSIAGYIYLTPDQSQKSLDGKYYTELAYSPLGNAAKATIKTQNLTALPLNNYAIRIQAVSGDYKQSDGSIVTNISGSAVTIPIQSIAGYWLNEWIDPNLHLSAPTKDTGYVYQQYASTIFIDTSGQFVLYPFGVAPTVPNISSVTALPKDWIWVQGTIGVTNSDTGPTNYDYTDGHGTFYKKVTIPTGSLMDPTGHIILPNGTVYMPGTYAFVKLNKQSGIAPSGASLLQVTDPQVEQEQFFIAIQKALGAGFELAFGPPPPPGVYPPPPGSNPYPNFEQKLEDTINQQQRTSTDSQAGVLTNDPNPSPVEEWQCRIGGSLFFVPPINIAVNQTFESGSLTGAAIRQISSPKFNSGHSETTITMTLFFPGVDQIWGYEGGKIDINFDTDPAEKVDTFLSSLRGLIAQFRYTPFVPIVNQYLNSVWNITAVGFRGMNLSTVPGYPFLIRCDLELVRFNHQVYMPMVAALDDAIDWGRFRQFVGRAAIRMDDQANQSFVVDSGSYSQGASLYQGSGGTHNIDQANPQADLNGTDSVLNRSISQDIASANYGASTTDASSIQFYFPTHDPANYIGPTDNITQYGFDNQSPTITPEQWQGLINAFGLGKPENGYIPLNGQQQPDLQQIINSKQNSVQADIEYVIQYFKTFGNILNALTDPTGFRSFSQAALKANYSADAQKTGSSAWEVAMKSIEGAWYWYIWQQITTSGGFLDQLFAIQNYLRGTVEIDEWDVPMSQLPLDSNFIVEQIRVSLGNNLARLQLHMLDQPAYQHIGGLDTSINITATCVGEKNLTLIRNMFDTINSLARLEHSHAVLGFLGIRNLLVALAGTRYVIPKSYNVETIPGYPHVYRVELTFLDFDVFQQKREMLNTQQETQFVELMSKRNPFLRLQQVWTAFNAYTDFPLAVKDPDTGAILGYLDPDYYFKAFDTIDDDVVQNFASEPTYTKVANPTQTDQSTGFQPVGQSNNSDYPITWHFGPLSDAGNHQSIGISGAGGMDLRSGTNIMAQNLQINEAHAGNTQVTPIVKASPGQPYLATAASGYIFPNFELNKPTPQTGVNTGGTTAPPYMNTNSGTSMGNFQAILHDLQYRNVSGRMIRAFPTYMLWFIDEGGLFAGMQLFGDFYGLQSVIDFSHVQNQDVLGDTLTIRISNLYSRLSTDFQEQVDPAIFPELATLINPALQTVNTIGKGLDPFAVANIATINLKPGARLHLRVGYGSNPNLLETIFNGVITEVQQGDILTIVAQSDAVELGALVNTTNPSGSSGHIDGALTTGFYLSEPRDLIVRLLSMGGSNFEEMIQYATRGMLFSQSRFGIRHFGNMLYDTVTDREHSLVAGFFNKLSSITTMATNWLGINQDVAGGGGAVGSGGAFGLGLINPQIGSIAMQLWANLNTTRDYEIYKRNVYPGNGLGVANYMGGDLGDGGIFTAFQPPGINASGEFNTAVPDTFQQIRSAVQSGMGQTAQNPVSTGQPDNQNLVDSANQLMPVPTGSTSPISNGTTTQHPIWTWLGLTPTVKDDVPGNSKALVFTYGPFAEISFRAETYQRTVWDLFQTCAKLLPNYIVAVRPWMERSTVFYGKPHWAWTSGVIPITYGADAGSNSPPVSGTSQYASLQNSINQIIQLQNAFNQTTGSQTDVFTQIQDIITNTGGTGVAGTAGNDVVAGAEAAMTALSNDPNNTTPTDGTGTTGGDPNANTGKKPPNNIEITALPSISSSGATLPTQSGKVGIEMHLPTTDPNSPNALQNDIKQHKQLASLPLGMQHPFYMDRVGGPSGGYANLELPPTSEQQVLTTAILSGDDSTKPGQPSGGFGVLDPDSEQWYICMRWDNSHKNYPNAWKGTRILVYNPENQYGCVCTPGDWGPNITTKRDGGISPDVWQALGQPAENAPLWFGFLGPTAKLGPVQWQGETFMSKAIPTTAHISDLSLLDSAHDNASSGSVSSGTVVLGDIGITGNIMNVPLPNVPPELSAVPDVKNQYTVLDLARKVYGGTKTDSQAIEIFNQFKQDFYASLGTADAPNTSSALYKIFTGQQQVAKDNNAGGVQVVPYTTTNTRTTQAQFNQDYFKAATSFYNWMVGNPYNIGWLVLTADIKLSVATNLASGIADVFGALPFRLADSIGIGYDSFFGNKSANFSGEESYNPIQAIVDDVFSFFGGGPADTAGQGWDLSKTQEVFAVWMTLGPGKDTNNPDDATNSTGGATEWMIANAKPGNQDFTVFGDTITSDIRSVAGTIGTIVKDATNAISIAFSAITDILRFSFSLLNMGINLSGFSGQQANLLNSTLNDSYYYDPNLGVGSLLWQVDNAFTREYGEPVVEIREPFQKVHYINSYQHILTNGLIETMQNVYTVVTASANGKSPHTAWFDKGAPSQYQYEKAVDTGLYIEVPNWYTVLLHPSNVIRDIQKHLNNSDDGTEASRFARAELQKSLKGIYAGEIMVLGDPSIRPFDLLYISDSYERIYGLCEVQQVVHHFTPETGFITAITPAALVTVNDPERWEAGSIIQRQLAIQDLRNQIRIHAGVVNGASGTAGLSNPIDINTLIQQEENALQGTTQFAGGATAILKDIGGSTSMGSATAKVGAVGLGAVAAGGLAGLAAYGATLFAGWEAFSWIRDNLLDAHGCYIQYLNRNGAPMDSGLSYNQGVAVGQLHTYSGLRDILGIDVKYSIDGSPMITTTSLLQNIGWNEQDTSQLKKSNSLFNAQTRDQIAGFYAPALSNQNPHASGTYSWAAVEVNGIIDPITLSINITSGVGDIPASYKKFRLQYLATPGNSVSSNNPALALFNPITAPSAEAYLKDLFFGANAGSNAQCAIRVDPHHMSDPNDPTALIGVLFYYIAPSTLVPPPNMLGPTLQSSDRLQILVSYANNNPPIGWQDVQSDGQPFTLNWQMVVTNHATIDSSLLLPTGQGAATNILSFHPSRS